MGLQSQMRIKVGVIVSAFNLGINQLPKATRGASTYEKIITAPKRSTNAIVNSVKFWNSFGTAPSSALCVSINKHSSLTM